MPQWQVHPDIIVAATAVMIAAFMAEAVQKRFFTGSTYG